MEATPPNMRLHTSQKNLLPTSLDPEPSTRASDSSFPPIPSLRPCPVPSLRNLCALSVSALDSSYFLAPLHPRWSPVVFQRKTPSISFFFMPLRDSSLPNDRASTPLPYRSLGASTTSRTSFNSLNFFALIFLRTLLRYGFSQLLSFQSLPHSLAKTTGGTYPSNANHVATGGSWPGLKPIEGRARPPD
jgi:hypothetical protein